MLQEYNYRPKMVCASSLHFELDDDNKIHDLHFQGGCNGNLSAIARLVEGMDASKVAELLRGNQCGSRSTSCADQFAQAIEQALAERAD